MTITVARVPGPKPTGTLETERAWDDLYFSNAFSNIPSHVVPLYASACGFSPIAPTLAPSLLKEAMGILF